MPKPTLAKQLTPGSKWGGLTVLRFSHRDAYRAAFYLVKCHECGGNKPIRGTRLLKSPRTCGCGANNHPGGPLTPRPPRASSAAARASASAKLRAGDLIHHLKLLALVPGLHPRWECRCDCGRPVTVTARKLIGRDARRSCQHVRCPHSRRGRPPLSRAPAAASTPPPTGPKPKPIPQEWIDDLEDPTTGTPAPATPASFPRPRDYSPPANTDDGDELDDSGIPDDIFDDVPHLKPKPTGTTLAPEDLDDL